MVLTWASRAPEIGHPMPQVNTSVAGCMDAVSSEWAGGMPAGGEGGDL